jgi:putative SOS response-associated peptidase YedK
VAEGASMLPTSKARIYCRPSDCYLCGRLHTEPVILAEEHHEKWLGEIEDGDLKELLKPYPADQMKMWPISPRVNSPKNDDEAILSSI